jgi:integrative and conjugative element protein (TIGR02256 family)
MIVYPIDASGQRLIFTTSVTEHFVRHRQVRWWHREAGGQLFARFDLPNVIIEEATGPRRTDWRTRNSYRPNRRAEQKEISNRHRRGLHFVGDWHTHPESIPSPSEQDEVSMQDMVSRSDHALNGFVLAIVGIELPPRGLHVSVVSRSSRRVLEGGRCP